MSNPIIETFHLDWKLMVAQLFNFGVVVLVLWFFALKPLAKKMQERTKIIEKGIEDAKESAQKLSIAEKEKKEIIQEARQQAQNVLAEMEKLSSQEKEQILALAKAKSEKLIEDAKKELLLEKDQVIQQAKKEVAELVVLATQKVLSKEYSDKIDSEIIQKSLKEAEKELKQHE